MKLARIPSSVFPRHLQLNLAWSMAIMLTLSSGSNNASLQTSFVIQSSQSICATGINIRQLSALSPDTEPSELTLIAGLGTAASESVPFDLNFNGSKGFLNKFSRRLPSPLAYSLIDATTLPSKADFSSETFSSIHLQTHLSAYRERIARCFPSDIFPKAVTILLRVSSTFESSPSMVFLITAEKYSRATGANSLFTASYNSLRESSSMRSRSDRARRSMLSGSSLRKSRDLKYSLTSEPIFNFGKDSSTRFSLSRLRLARSRPGTEQGHSFAASGRRFLRPASASPARAPPQQPP